MTYFLMTPHLTECVYLYGGLLRELRSSAGLLDQLTVNLVLQLRVGQTHLQCILGQRDVVVDGRRVQGNTDEELT